MLQLFQVIDLTNWSEERKLIPSGKFVFENLSFMTENTEIKVVGLNGVYSGFFPLLISLCVGTLATSLCHPLLNSLCVITMPQLQGCITNTLFMKLIPSANFVFDNLSFHKICKNTEIRSWRPKQCFVRGSHSLVSECVSTRATNLFMYLWIIFQFVILCLSDPMALSCILVNCS